MRTQRSFSTISYNTDTFLNQKLGELEKRRAISFWCWIDHYPEDDELKRHKHVFIIPNGQIDTDTVRKELEEIDLKDPLGKPLGCMLMRPSKFDDWYLYGIHDTAYLASKGQTRKHHYQESDIHPNGFPSGSFKSISSNSLRTVSVSICPFGMMKTCL